MDTTTRNAIARVCLSSLVFFSGLSLLLPIFPLWLSRFSDSNLDVGLATGFAAGLGLLVARPIAARFMEGRHRAPVLIAGALVANISCASFPWLDSLSAVVAVRVAQGLGFGLMTTAAVSLVTDLAPPEKRGQVMGYFGASNAVALLAGPMVGAWLFRELGPTVTFLAAAGFGLLTIPLVMGLDEPPKERVAARFGLFDALQFPGMKALVVAHFLAILLHGTLLTFLPLLFETHPGWMSTEAFFALDAVALIGLRVAVGRHFDALGRGLFARAGLLGIAGGGLLLSLATSDIAFAAAALLYGLGFGAYLPTANALVGDRVPASHRARGFAVFMLAFDLSFACGGVFFGPIADRFDLPTTFLLASLMPLLALFIAQFGGALKADHGPPITPVP